MEGRKGEGRGRGRRTVGGRLCRLCDQGSREGRRGCRARRVVRAVGRAEGAQQAGARHPAGGRNAVFGNLCPKPEPRRGSGGKRPRHVRLPQRQPPRPFQPISTLSLPFLTHNQPPTSLKNGLHYRVSRCLPACAACILLLLPVPRADSSRRLPARVHMVAKTGQEDKLKYVALALLADGVADDA